MIKNKKFLQYRFIYFALIIGVAAFLSGATFQKNEDIYDKINRNMDVFGKVYKEIALNYVDAVDVDKFFKAGIEGMLGTLDPYTVYYDDKSRDVIDLITSGKYGGIGITIELKDSLLRVTDIMNGYEAQRKGLRIGDVINQIDDVNLSGMQLEKVRQLVRGTAGSKLNMKIIRDNEVINFELIRQEITLKNISYSGFIGNQEEGIAYFRLDRFTNTSVDEVENTLKTFKSKTQLKGLIFDLRNNGGGLLDAAIGILNKLVEKNSLLVSTKGSSKESDKKYFSREESLIPNDVPLIVLVNQNTASASEIVSGAIQDLDRGIIIGSKSYGKGLVQQIKDIGYESRLKLTTARYFTPSGRWIQEKNYFKENKSGVFLNTENFLQKDFKTINGRTVYANGGITPDIEIKLEGESEIHIALFMKDMFFKFANYYLKSNPDIKVFKCTDEIFDEFRNFIYTKNFYYKSEADKNIDALKETGNKHQYSSKFNDYINNIEKEVSKEKESELIKAREEIKLSIEAEINKMIITEKEQIEATFYSDKQLQEAIRIIKNKDEYIKILGKQ